MTGTVVVHDAAAGKWLRFDSPVEVITAAAIHEVAPALRTIEELAGKKNLYAAGFLSYESAAAFDPAFSTHSPNFPLLWFGLYRVPEEIILPQPDFKAYSLGDAVPTISRLQYEQAIERIKEYIESGDTYQVNYTFRMRSPFSGDPWHLFLAMVRAQSPGYAAWLDLGRYAVCSASPELFFRLEGNRIICKPMKGTVGRGRTLAEDRSLAHWLQNSEKNRAENLMIVDMIRNDLGRVAETGTVGVPHMFEVERHPTLWQMTSTVTAGSAGSLTDIMGALFPCASITGAPKIRTTGIIRELEPDPRGLYTGCIGFTAAGRRAQFNVAIRTAVVDRERATVAYGSGGGVVWDSRPDDEYTESLLKARVLREQQPEFRLLESLLWTAEESYFLLEEHLDRLSDSAAYFGYRADIEQIRRRLMEEASSLSKEPYKVRLLVGADGAVEVQSEPLALSDASLRVRPAVEAVNSADVFLYHKTTLRRVYEDARRSCPDCDDVLLWNERRELTESISANIVLEADGELLTPPVECGLLAGTYRARLLQGGVVKERVLGIDMLNRCSNIYLVNSVRKWRKAVLAD